MSIVLIVDDQLDMAELMQEMVSFAGFDSEIAYSGEEALALARQRRPDLVLSDVTMPEMDGWTLFTRLKDFLESPVLFMTTHNTADYRAKAHKLGAAGLVGKNISPYELARRLQTLMSAHSGS